MPGILARRMANETIKDPRLEEGVWTTGPEGVSRPLGPGSIVTAAWEYPPVGVVSPTAPNIAPELELSPQN